MIKHFKKILNIFGRKNINKIIFFVIFLIFVSIIELIGIGLIPLYVSSLLQPELIEEKILFLKNFEKFSLNFDLFIIVGIFLIVIFLLKNIFIGIFTYLFNLFLKNLHLDLTKNLYSSYLKSELKFIKKYNSNIITRNVINEASLTIQYIKIFIYLTKEVLILLGIFVALLYFSLKVTLFISSVFLAILIIFFKIFRRKLNIIGKEGQEIRGKLLKLISESFGSIFDIKIFSSEKIFEKNYSNLVDKQLSLEFQSNIISAIPKILFEIIVVSSIVFLSIYFFSLNYNTPEVFTILSAVAVISIRFLPMFNLITSSIARLRSISYSLNLINNEINKFKFKEEYNNNANHLNFEYNITISIPEFRYEDYDRNILCVDKLEIKKTESIGIYGASGSGKTSFLNIFSGLYSIDKGFIEVDKININKNLISWQNKIGYVSQSIFLIDDTVKKNIVFDREIKDQNDEKIHEILNLLNLKEFINSLPNGIDSKIGEMGSNLSAGQRQRLGIARAIYNDPEILILDEATSNLDTETEKEIFKSLFDIKFKKNRTYILISHQSRNLLNCDKIYKLDNGKMIDKTIELKNAK